MVGAEERLEVGSILNKAVGIPDGKEVSGPVGKSVTAKSVGKEVGALVGWKEGCTLVVGWAEATSEGGTLGGAVGMLEGLTLIEGDTEGESVSVGRLLIVGSSLGMMLREGP